MDAWDFNAPVYQDFEVEGQQENTRSNENPTTGRMDTQEIKSNSEALENMEVGVDDSKPERATFRVPNKTPQKRNSCTPTQSVRQSPRLAAIAKSIRRSNASRGLVSTNSPGERQGHRRSLSEGSSIAAHFSKVKKSNVQRKVAVVRPKISEAASSNLTADEISTLEETTKFKKAMMSNRQRASNSQKGPLKAGPMKPTKPVEFNFATDSRTRAKNDDASDDCLVDFQKSLRSGTNINDQPNNHPKGNTKVKPFNLHSSAKPKEAAQPFLSMAELNLKFHTKTPQRFRTQPLNSNTSGDKRKKNEPLGITQPKTPRLSTRARARSVDYPSWEEIEKKEFEEAQKHQFKAKPLNKKILVEPDIKPHESSKVVTVPEPFDITDTRNESIKLSSKALMESCKGLISASELNSIPHAGVSSVWEKRRTEVKPFSFDSRDEETLRKKKEKIIKTIEEERKLSEFHAQPMPILDTVVGLPPKKAPTPTKLKPFNLHSDVRGMTKQQILQAELEAIEKQEKEQRKFKAQSDKVLHKSPFKPEASTKPLTDISGFSLNTDRRAEERSAFDLHLKEKEDLIQAEKRMREERKVKEEEEQVREIRKNAVHKAQPIKHYKPIEIKQGLLPPTVPVTPKFTIDQRLKARALSKQNLDGTPDTTSALNFTADSTSILNTTADTVTTNTTSSTASENGDLDTTFTMEV